MNVISFEILKNHMLKRELRKALALAINSNLIANDCLSLKITHLIEQIDKNNFNKK